MARILKSRLNLRNPFCNVDLEFDFKIDRYPREDDPTWLSIPLSEVDDKYHHEIEGFPIPKIEPEDLKAIDNLNIGSYWRKIVGRYFVLLKHREHELEKKEFANREAQIAELKKCPEKSIVKFKVLESEPEEWRPDWYGPFPTEGIILAPVFFTGLTDFKASFFH